MFEHCHCRVYRSEINYNDNEIYFEINEAISIPDQIWLMARQREDFSIEIRTIIHDALIRLSLDPDR